MTVGISANILNSVDRDVFYKYQSLRRHIPDDRRLSRETDLKQSSLLRHFLICQCLKTCWRKEVTLLKLDLSRSQWPRCLRYEMSSSAETLVSWVRNQREAWMSVDFLSVFKLCCICGGLSTGLIPRTRSPVYNI
jgi:hypothetical protein